MLRKLQQVRVWLAMFAILWAVGLHSPLIAQQTPAPTFDYQGVMSTFFHASNGMIRFDRHVVAFAPEGDFAAEVAVLGKGNQIIAQFPFQPSIDRSGVFGVVHVQGPAMVHLTEPGDYNIVYRIGDQIVTRMPVRLLKVESGDPFNPQTTYQFDGYWRTHAFLLPTSVQGGTSYDLNLWVGGLDLPAEGRSDRFLVEVIRDGQVVAHSRHNQGHIAQGHFKITRLPIFHPHEERAAQNARFFMDSDWLTEGSTQIRVTRASDGQVIRLFDVDVADGQIVPLPQTALGYQPQHDYLMPRVERKHGNTFQMTEAIWVSRKP